MAHAIYAAKVLDGRTPVHLTLSPFCALGPIFEPCEWHQNKNLNKTTENKRKLKKLGLGNFCRFLWG